MINHKFNEPELLKDIQEYIDKTYDQHYSANKFQSAEFIIDRIHGGKHHEICTAVWKEKWV